MTTDNSTDRRVVVVGAGHGGGAVVGLLRQFGFAGHITLVGDEPHAPYHRPPLSKAWLKGETTTEALAIKPGKFYEELKIALRLGQRATAIDPSARRLTFDDGETLDYDYLVLATGARARKLPVRGADLPNVLSLRNIADAERLRNALRVDHRLVIIGGGYIGLECAATARSLGVEVTVIERAPRLLERVASEAVADFLQRTHEARGVRFLLNAGIESIEGDHAAEAVRLTDGTRIPCEAVIVGIGAEPVTELAAAAGLACNDGVTVDEDCRSSHPDIFAIGDMAKRPHAVYGRPVRLESVPGSAEHARRVAAVICGREPPATEVPWFWSDQYDLKLQIVGLATADARTVVRGEPDSNSFAVFHLHDGKVVAVEAINAPPAFLAGKKLTASGKSVDPASLADPAADLKTIAQ
ncbi:MAG: FAD-dependent oxidoreductase [Thauera propionica]|jgi:3-phenylpropionate/trans-cinnamate dioxygenase ferredoxin reductase subunit|nr:FAD-dependent oxidoreductase [Thauera propionica]